MAVTNTASVGIITYVYSVSYCIICILGALSNALLLVAFIKDPLRCFRNSGTHLVMSLSVSDCLWCLLSLASQISPRISSDVIVRCFIILMANVSSVMITSISIDRFWMVSYPIRHRILMKSKVIVLRIAAIWIVNILISFFYSSWMLIPRLQYREFALIAWSLSYYRQLCTRLRITS